MKANKRANSRNKQIIATRRSITAQMGKIRQRKQQATEQNKRPYATTWHIRITRAPHTRWLQKYSGRQHPSLPHPPFYRCELRSSVTISRQVGTDRPRGNSAESMHTSRRDRRLWPRRCGPTHRRSGKRNSNSLPISDRMISNSSSYAPSAAVAP
jgi:hypothetical protein